MPTIEEQLRFFAVKVNNGSGCIFQPDTMDYSYVLTVKHNLEKEDKSILLPEEINVKRFNLENPPIKVNAIYTHESLDLAILIVEYTGNPDFLLSYAMPLRDEVVKVFGYPDYLKDQQIKTTDLPCKCGLEHDKGISFEVVSENQLISFNRGAQKNVIGFSGSGIFYLEENTLVLKGIFPRLNDPEGAHNKLNGLYISSFEDIINKNGLLELIPSCLKTFNEHKDVAFNTINQVLRDCLTLNLDNVLNSGISPISISNQFQGALYAPFSASHRNKLLNTKMWKAWIELLTYLDISTDNPDYTLTTFLRNTKLYHSVNKNVIDEFVRIFLSDQALMKTISANDLVVYSSEIDSASKFLKKEKIDKIVINIYRSRASGSGLNITDPRRIKPFSCIHIDHFAEKIADIDTDLLPDEIKELIKVEVQNILNYGNN